jgi:uncharacterized damage-inducible protein DinB
VTKPKYPAFVGSERELLENHLEHNRLTVRHKVAGLTLDLATQRLGNSHTSAAGIVKHLSEVEGWWFRRFLNGEEWTGVSTNENPDAEFDIDANETVETLLDEYDKACELSRSICKNFQLDDLSKRPYRNDLSPSLRWIYLHMIEEIARHNGHLDLYRELLDGTTDGD